MVHVFNLLLYFLWFISSVGVSIAQSNEGEDPKYFAAQLLNLETELEVFRDKIDQKELQIREVLKQETNSLYMLRQKQRDVVGATDDEKQKLAKEIQILSANIRKKKIRMNEVRNIMGRKRKDIFALKLSIDEWVAKVEATEKSVIQRITRMKDEISSLIKTLDQEFHVGDKKVTAGN